MAFVMAHEHHAHRFGPNLVEDMVGKAFEVRPSEALVREVKSQRVLPCLGNAGPQLGVELVGEPGRDLAVEESASWTSPRTSGW